MSPSSPLQFSGNMEILSLSSYLEVLGQPALVLTSTAFDGPVSESLSPCYMNPVFRELINLTGDGSRDAWTNRGAQFKSILQARCVVPTSSQFLEWIQEFKEANVNVLKSIFRRPNCSEERRHHDTGPEFVDLEWNGAMVQDKYIVLIGRYLGAPSFFSTTPTSSEPDSLRFVSDPPPVEQKGHYETPTATCSRSTMSAIHIPNGSPKVRRTSRNSVPKPLSRLSSFEEQSVNTTSLGYTWQSHEKV